jgi:hypothetical protein
MRAVFCILASFSIAAAMFMNPAAASDFTRITRALTDLPAPPHGRSEWIARSMRMNGLPMTIKSFRSRLTADDLCQHYEAAGLRQHVTTRRSRNGEWSVLSIKARNELITIQARDTVAGSEGTMTVSPILEKARLNVVTTFPRPLSTSVVNLQEYDDEGIEAEFISLASSRSITVEGQAFMDKLQRDGWQIQQRPAQSGVRIIEAQKGAQHALLNLMRNHAQPGTAIVVVRRKS